MAVPPPIMATTIGIAKPVPAKRQAVHAQYPLSVKMPPIILMNNSNDVSSVWPQFLHFICMTYILFENEINYLMVFNILMEQSQAYW